MGISKSMGAGSLKKSYYMGGGVKKCIVPPLCFYAPNFEEVDGAYWIQVVRASVHASIRNMHAISYEPCMLGF